MRRLVEPIPLLPDMTIEGPSMAWLYLIIAGVFEWGWPIGLKFGLTDEGVQPWPLTGFQPVRPRQQQEEACH